MYDNYRPQTKFAKVMFLQVSVCPGGAVHGRGACMVGGMCGGGMHGRGACVVGDMRGRGTCMGECAWQEGMHGGGHVCLSVITLELLELSESKLSTKHQGQMNKISCLTMLYFCMLVLYWIIPKSNDRSNLSEKCSLIFSFIPWSVTLVHWSFRFYSRFRLVWIDP